MRLLLLAAALIPCMALADAKVISVKPKYVTIYQQQCTTQDVLVENTASGALVGGVVGGALGNQVGGGSGKTAATIVGAIVGSNIGRANAQNNARIETRQICNQVPVTVQQGETVTFDYNGKIFTQTFE